MAKAKKSSKPTLATRKPPAAPPVDARAVEQFVGSVAPSLPGHRIAVRTDGREMRRLTVYLPTDVYRRLAAHSTMHDKDRSAVIAEALTAYCE